MKRLGLAAAGAAVVLGLVTPTAAAAGPPAWQTPRCGVVTGDGAISFTRDDGARITPTTVAPRPVQYVRGLTPLSMPNTLLAVDDRGLVQTSADAGCSWTEVGTVTGIAVPSLTAGPSGEAYVWDVNGLGLFRVDDGTVTALPPITATGADVVTLAVDRFFPRHLRAVLEDGTVVDSFDAGRSFHVTAQPGHPDLYVYSASIDPLFLNHVSIGTMSEGVYTTWTSGRQWTQANIGARVNAFTVTMSPANPLVVWAQGIDLAEHEAGAPHEGRHIYRSTDGGHTFGAAVDHVPGQVTLVNGALLAPSPVDQDVLYFEFGTSFAGYGTDLFRYDARLDRLTMRHNNQDGISSIAFNPKDARVLYLGFAVER